MAVYITIYGQPYPELPYPQHCLCESYPTHVANDCHIHNEQPVHFDDEDDEHPCTCRMSEQEIKEMEPSLTVGETVVSTATP